MKSAFKGRNSRSVTVSPFDQLIAIGHNAPSNALGTQVRRIGKVVPVGQKRF
jgi:hypothetical protein